MTHLRARVKVKHFFFKSRNPPKSGGSATLVFGIVGSTVATMPFPASMVLCVCTSTYVMYPSASEPRLHHAIVVTYRTKIDVLFWLNISPLYDNNILSMSQLFSTSYRLDIQTVVFVFAG